MDIFFSFEWSSVFPTLANVFLLLLLPCSSRFSVPLCSSSCSHHSSCSVPRCPPPGPWPARLQRRAGRRAPACHSCLPWVKNNIPLLQTTAVDFTCCKSAPNSVEVGTFRREPSNIYFVQCLGKSTEWHLMNNFCKLCLTRSLCSSVTSTLFTPLSFQRSNWQRVCHIRSHSAERDSLMELPHWRFIWISRQIPPSADLHKHTQTKCLHRFATSDSLFLWPVFVFFVPSLCALCMSLLCCDDWLTGSWLLWFFFSDRKHNWPNNVFWLLTKIQLNPAKRGEIDECRKCPLH